ncbi:MAG TPA: hypothetical protein VJ302_17130 [Blastocatellia bacterium]|nr:hypothetical protein [Blastocatellia bacterium]
MNDTTRVEVESRQLHLGGGLQTRVAKSGSKKMGTAGAVYTMDPYLRTTGPIVSDRKINGAGRVWNSR